MNFTDISYLRLINQQIITSKFENVKDTVGWMGAMQAQDYNMAKWAIGVRLPGFTDKAIESAIDEGEIIRMHLLRPTWHFVSSEDIYWMLDLTAPQIKNILKSRDKTLELDQNVYLKSNAIIENAMQGGKHLTREEIVAEIEKVGIATDNNRAYHLLLRAELDGIICSGKIKNNKQMYALLKDRVPKVKYLSREEALSLLAKRYFTSHGPATLQDFAWWSGLSLTDSKIGLEMAKSNLVSEIIDNKAYWFTDSYFIPKLANDSIYLLPAYDEFIISYRDRTASLPIEKNNKAVSNNGVFRPTIVINGQVAGIWKRTIKKEKIILETELFQPTNQAINRLLEEAVKPFENYMNKKVKK